MQNKVINFNKNNQKGSSFFQKPVLGLLHHLIWPLRCVLTVRQRIAISKKQINLWFSKTLFFCESDAMQIKKIAIAAAIAASLAFVGCSKKADEHAAEAQDSAAQASAAAADAATAATDAAAATTADATADATAAAADAANNAADAANDAANAAADSADSAANAAATPAAADTATTTTAPAAAQ